VWEPGFLVCVELERLWEVGWVELERMLGGGWVVVSVELVRLLGVGLGELVLSHHRSDQGHFVRC
jgi:hypothetical protein